MCKFKQKNFRLAVNRRALQRFISICTVFLLVTVASTCVLAQSDKALFTDTTVYERVDEIPEFPSGVNGLERFVRRKLDLNGDSKDLAKNAAPAVAEFIVEADGRVNLIGVNCECDETVKQAVAKVFTQMPNWIPGKLDGKNVRTRLHFPVSFQYFLGVELKKNSVFNSFQGASLSFNKIRFYDNLSNYMNVDFGLELDFFWTSKTWQGALLFRLYSTNVERIYRDKKGIWKAGRESWMYQAGAEIGYSVFQNRVVDIAPNLSTSLLWHSPVIGFNTDPADGLTVYGTRICAGLNTGIALHSNCGIKLNANYGRMYLPDPLKGGSYTFGVGLYYGE